MSEMHPYKSQPEKAFWRPSVEERHFLKIHNWYERKWDISNSRMATAGSCFAQHIGRHLRTSGFKFIDVEPPPEALARTLWGEYGYGLYSGRYGNIYSSRQLLQLLMQATGEFSSKETPWTHGEGFVDPFRPSIEPEPLSSADEVMFMRERHLKAVAQLFERTDVFVFTLGLTETWVSKEDGAVFPLCPGTQGGKFSSSRYKYINLSFPQVKADMEDFISRARQINGRMKFLLTVSPVPLMATASKNHVVVATSYSKSVLRSVAGFLAEKYRYVDYFPSYEIINSHPMRSAFYEPDLRGVVDIGVEHVMQQFFSQHVPPGVKVKKSGVAPRSDEDLICDEALLAEFHGEKK